MKKIKLSLIIPCYNEEKRFISPIEKILKYLSSKKFSWEIILVDDGSTDNTLKLMRKEVRKDPRIKVVSYGTNKGKGFAIKKGFEESSGEYVVFSDIDLSVPVNTSEKFWLYFKKNYDVVIGSRRVKGAKILIRQNLFREFLGRGFSFLVSLLINPVVKDATCGFKGFKGDIGRFLFSKSQIFDWSFDAEILFLAKKFGYRLAQVPVEWSEFGGTKVNALKEVFRSLAGLLKIRFNNFLGRYD